MGPWEWIILFSRVWVDFPIQWLYLALFQINGKIYVTACPRCHLAKSSSDKDGDGDAESCGTFRMVSVAGDVKRYSGRVSFFHPLDGCIVTFGGFAITTNEKVHL